MMRVWTVARLGAEFGASAIVAHEKLPTPLNSDPLAVIGAGLVGMVASEVVINQVQRHRRWLEVTFLKACPGAVLAANFMNQVLHDHDPVRVAAAVAVGGLLSIIGINQIDKWVHSGSDREVLPKLPDLPPEEVRYLLVCNEEEQ